MVWQGSSRRGSVWQSRRGGARHFADGLGAVRLGRAWQGVARHGWAGVARHCTAGLGLARLGRAWQAWGIDDMRGGVGVTWFRVDDSLPFHAKVVTAGNAAVGLWARAGAWSAQHLTDGFVPTAIARTLGTAAEARRLVAAGLWVDVDGGYRFHEWDERQPSRAEVEERRQRKADGGVYGNHLRWHVSRGVTDPDCSACRSGPDSHPPSQLRSV